MPKYRFIVRAESGKVRRGTLTEESEQSARKRLEEAGFEVVSLVESTDLVVHTPQTTQGRTKYSPVRADIIDFEETLDEKFVNLLNRFLLRREVALMLGILGLIWVVVSGLGKEEPKKAPEVQYVAYEVSVSVDTQDYDANLVEVRLPDIPFKVSEPIDRDSEGAQTVKLEFEAANKPERIEVAVLDGQDVLARGDGLLQSSGQGKFSFSPNLVRESKDDDY